MTEQVRYRIDKRLAAEARIVLAEIGLDPTSAVSAFFAQVVKLRALPFQPSAFPALAEYGATLEQADAAEKKALQEWDAERAAGRVSKFNGKL